LRLSKRRIQSNLSVRGVGEKKLADLGQRFLEEIVTY